MAETTRRRSGELLRKLFEILKQSPEGSSAAAALEQLANSVQLTEYEAGNYGSGGRRFEKIVRFATVDCVKAGWLVKNKGTWMVTEVGLEAHSAERSSRITYEQAEEQAWGEIEAHVGAMDPYEFQPGASPIQKPSTRRRRGSTTSGGKDARSPRRRSASR